MPSGVSANASVIVDQDSSRNRVKTDCVAGRASAALSGLSCFFVRVRVSTDRCIHESPASNACQPVCPLPHRGNALRCHVIDVQEVHHVFISYRHIGRVVW